MPERRVVFVNRYFFPDHSATSQLLSDLAFQLAAHGVAVTVVTSRQIYDDAARRLPRHERVRGVEIRRVWTTRNGRAVLLGRAFDYLTFYLSTAWALLRLLRPGDTVVAKTDPPLISVVVAAVARWRGASLVNWVQDLFPEVAVALRLRAAMMLEAPLRRLRNWSFGTARWNVAIGDRMARRMVAQGGEPSRITVIHNWSTVQDLRPRSPDEVGLRDTWGLKNRFVVGYSGNMGRAHDFDTILEAARLLRDTPDVVFLFIGAGAQRGRIEAEAENHGLTNIVFKPYQPHEMLRESLCVPDVHLISLQPELEGCIVPSKFYGIAAAGRAMIHIGLEEGEPGQLIRQADCGLVIEPGQAVLLAGTLRKLAADPAKCRALGARARHLHEHRFDRAIALKQWERILAPGDGIDSII